MEQESNKKSLIFLILFISVIGILFIYLISAGIFKHNSPDTVSKEVTNPSYTTARVSVGNTIKINAEGSNKELKWVSSNANIASVEEGLVTGNSQGTTVIYVYVEDKVVAKCEVTVYASEDVQEQTPFQPEEPEVVLPGSLSLEESNVSLYVGEKKIIVATIQPENTSDNEVHWSSSDSSVVSVLNGELTANGIGTAIVKAETNNGLVATVTVTVKEKPAEDLTINKTSATIIVGNSVALKALLVPSYSVDNSVIWTSSNTKVATVNNGVVTGKSVGNTTIIVKNNSGKTASATITVINKPSKAIPVNGISIKYDKSSLLIGESTFIRASVKPSNASNQTITWSSSDSSVVTVYDGLVTAKKVGTARITAKAYNGMSSTVTITVKNIEPRTINLNKKEITITIGSSSTLQATILPNDATNKVVTWSSSDPSVATVDKGVVVGKKAGKTNITATTYNGHSTLCVVNVKPIAVTKVTLNSSSGTINVGKTVKLTATVSPSNATNKKITWKSSNTSVATVDSNGNVKGIKAGKADITATANNGVKATYKATVVVPVSKVVIQYNSKTATSISTKIGTNITLKAVVSPSNATTKTVTWSTSNSKIATVKDGVVTPKRTGNVNITAKSNNGKTATVAVTISGSRIHFIHSDIPSDTILLESNGHFAMLDVGLASNKTVVETYLKDLGISKLDFLILSHIHSDHAGAAVYLAGKFNFNKLYLKSYTGHDLVKPEEKDALKKRQDSYTAIKNAFKGKEIIYVDKNSNFKETASQSGSVKLSSMTIYFYNTYSRMEKLPSGTTNKYPGYFKKSYYYGSTENVNSLVNLVKVNGFNVLLGGDMSTFPIMKDIFANRINGKISKIDIFKLPHHGYFNCFSSLRYPKAQSYTLSASVGRYVFTNSINRSYKVVTPYADGTYNITAGKVIYSDETKANPYSSCPYNIAKGDTAKAKSIMCNAYYSMDAKKAVVFNLSGSSVTVSGGGQGKSTAPSRCK